MEWVGRCKQWAIAFPEIAPGYLGIERQRPTCAQPTSAYIDDQVFFFDRKEP